MFAGGPAPAANAVIAAAASAFLRSQREVLGILHGYSLLQKHRPGEPLLEGTHYHAIQNADLRGLRNSRGVLIGTGRAHPGKDVRTQSDLDDPQKTGGLHAVYTALCELNVDALISIGGDGTLRTANMLYEYQRRLPADAPRVRIVHVPKTIDNDYGGIDFTFGFFTAVDVIAKALLNLRADAIATRSYFIAATMGRRAGWLAYGVAIAGEAHLVLGMEDVHGALADAQGKLDFDALVERIVELIITRAARGRDYGVVVLAEGLVELLPDSVMSGVPRDEFGHVSFSQFDLARVVAERVARRHREKTRQSVKVTGLQFGYEARCAAPHAFDVMLATQLGFGAYRALCEDAQDGQMISVSGQLVLKYIPFASLIDAQTLGIAVRLIDPNSDFHRLAQHLGTKISAPD